jgi:peptidoglycan/LPS O-acetylase OafA/YrhL
MRTITAAIAALGGGLLIAAFVVSAVHGDAPEAYWLLLGPLPFLAIGLAGYLRQPGRPVTWWLVGTGAAFGGDLAIGDVFLPMAENHWGVTSLATATIALAPLARRSGAGGRRRPDRAVPVRPAGRPPRARRHLDGDASRLPAPAARGGQPG